MTSPPSSRPTRVERPKNRDHGDWSTNVALQLAKSAGMPPRELAARVAERLAKVAGVSRVDVAGPGFLNITLDAASAGELARTIVETGAVYGHNDSAKGQVVNLEFISANPTGPLHLGHTAGPPWATPCTGCSGLRRRHHRRVLHQRRRRTDGQLRPQRPRPGQGRADP